MTAGLPAVWFPTIRAGTGSDVFTQRLCTGLVARGFRAEIFWLPHRAEYLPWSVRPPKPPAWANIVHANTWLHRRFVPANLTVVATMHHSVHDPDLRRYKSQAQALYHRWWIRPIERCMLRRAGAVTAVSCYTARKAQAAFKTANMHVVYNGMPMPEPSGSPRNPPRKPFRLLYVGSWSKRKGVDLLQPIMELLGKDFELRFTADPSVSAALPANCKSLGRPDPQQLELAYRESDALLFPTRLEGFGQVALEAMAHGLPVIATNGSALPEVVKDGVTGILCRQDEPEAFAMAARRLMLDPDLWGSMSRAALAHAHQSVFSVDSMVDGYLRIYETLLREKCSTMTTAGATAATTGNAAVADRK